MALWGGTVHQPDGKLVLQLFVSASDVQHLLGLNERHYNSYDVGGGDLRLDGSEEAEEVWLCVVPDELAEPPGR